MIPPSPSGVSNRILADAMDARLVLSNPALFATAKEYVNSEMNKVLDQRLDPAMRLAAADHIVAMLHMAAQLDMAVYLGEEQLKRKGRE